MQKQTISKVTLWANRAVAAVVLVLIFTLPALLKWYAGLLGYMPNERDLTALVVAFWCCAVVILFALWHMENLMHNILRQQIFVRENVKLVRRVQHSCAIVAVICLVATVFALPAILFTAIMGFLCLVVSVVASVLDAAVELREENDLTI